MGRDLRGVQGCDGPGEEAENKEPGQEMADESVQ